jgi:hypothetical protein
LVHAVGDRELRLGVVVVVASIAARGRSPIPELKLNKSGAKRGTKYALR